MTQFDPLYIVREELQPPPGDEWFTKIQKPEQAPRFTTREASLVFFGCRKFWLQLLLNTDESVRGDIEPLNIQVGKDGYRRMSLREIEMISHVLFRYGKISTATFINSIRILKAIADNYGLLNKGV